MKLYEYWLGLYPLDWEFCFMPVQTYKNFITEQYHKNPTFYNISAGSIEKVLAHIDVILSAAMEDWNNTTNHAALRCPPMIFPLPKGQESNVAEFAVILKMDHDGDEMEHADPLPLFSNLLREEYLWSEEYDEEEDEMRYEEDEVFPDDLFYSFYYYSWQAVLAYQGALEQEIPPEFTPKIAAVLEGL